MPVAQVLSRIDQLESTLGQMNRTAPAPQVAMNQASGSTAATSGLPGASSVPATSGSGGDFAAMMRVLDYAQNLNNPPARSSGASSSGSTGAASGASSPSRSAGTSEAQSTGGSSSTGSSAGTNSTSSSSAAASSTSTAGSGTAKTGADAVEIGKKYLGVPYVWGGNSASTGLDCSGLVKLVYEQMGVDLPRVAIDQARQGRAIPSLNQAEPGDLIVTHNGGHIGIYVGDGKMLHAPRPGRDVSIDPVSYFGEIMTIRRLVDSPSEAAAATSADAAASRRDFESRAGA